MPIIRLDVGFDVQPGLTSFFFSRRYRLFMQESPDGASSLAEL